MPSRLTVVLVSLLLATSFVTFWLWLVIPLARVSTRCPEGCFCFMGSYSVVCVVQTSESLPYTYPTGVRVLHIVKYNITTLDKDTFISRELTELENIVLTICRIETIELGAFNGLKKVKNLTLNQNEISELLPRTFERLSSLERLDLSSNRIETIELGAFNGLQKLKYLDLHSNVLSVLSPRTFEKLSSLEWLDLLKNRIETIELGAFNGLQKLTNLSLIYNVLSNLSSRTFGKLSSLEWLNLSKNRIETIELGAFNGLQKLKSLSLESNDLSVLSSRTFEKLSGLEWLDLSSNRIETIELGAFNGLQNLTNLSLINNVLSVLSPRTFEKLSSLEMLDLSINRIETIQLGAFNGLQNLTNLYLEYNVLSVLSPRTFENLSSLEKLKLTHNRIENFEVDVFSGLINLIAIFLSYNNIKYFDPDIFVGLPKLNYVSRHNNPDLQVPTDSHFINSPSGLYLDISNCNINSVSVYTFANVTALEWLDLSYNNLISVDINILKVLPKLSAMYLHDNPLECDCQLQEVWRWCQDHNIQTAFYYMAPVCDTPSEVQGIWWGVLEKGQCLQDNISNDGEYKGGMYWHVLEKGQISLSNLGIDGENEIKSYNYNEVMEEIYDENVILKVHKSIHAVLCTFGTAGNIILLIIIIHNKDMRTVPNLYILNLAISDIIYLIALFLDLYIIFDKKLYLVFFSEFVRRLSVGLSAYSVAVLSIQRYRVTVNPLHVRVSAQPTWRGAIVTVCAVWIVAALFAIPTALAIYVELYNLLMYNVYVHVFEFIVCSVLPVCVIAFCYVMTARHVLQSAETVSQQTDRPHLNARKRTANTVLGLTFVFLISNVPYHAWILYLSNKQYDMNHHYEFRDDKLICSATSVLLSLNSCLNPVALFCTSRAFKTKFKRYFTCRCKSNSSVSNIELARIN